MRKQVVAVCGALLLSLAACAPQPMAAETASGISSEAGSEAVPPVPSDEAVDEDQLTSREPSAAAVSASPSAVPTRTQPALRQGWSVVDKKLVTAKDLHGLVLPDKVSDYLKKRLTNPSCKSEITVSTVHSSNFMVASEIGVCNGSILGIYGPNAGEVTLLKVFDQVVDCKAFKEAGLPTRIPKSKILPDGVVCTVGDQIEKY